MFDLLSFKAAMITGSMVDAHQASESAANDRFLPAIGDGAHTALNAAALQRLSLKQHSKHAGVRVYRGNLVNNSDGAILDGVRSVDVSYIADTRGHGSSTAAAMVVGIGGAGAAAAAVDPASAAAASLRMRPQPPTAARVPHSARYFSGSDESPVKPVASALSAAKPAATLSSAAKSASDALTKLAAVHSAMESSKAAAAGAVEPWSRVNVHAVVEPSAAKAAVGASSRTEVQVVPASRADTVATADQLRLGLLGLPRGADLEAEVLLWDAAFGDVVRQVWVHCNERGLLLGAIRTRYAEITPRSRDGSSSSGG